VSQQGSPPPGPSAQFDHDRSVEAKLRALPAPAVIWFTWRIASRVVGALPDGTVWRTDADSALVVLRRCIDGDADSETCERALSQLRGHSRQDDELSGVVIDMIMTQALNIGASARSLRWITDPEAPASARQIARMAAHATGILGSKSFAGDKSRVAAMAAEREAQSADAAFLVRIPAAWWADSTSEFAVANWLAAVGPAKDYWAIVMDIATERGISPYEATHELGTPPTP
jgi:hypothetical protein